jgi:hypothetical protein
LVRTQAAESLPSRSWASVVGVGGAGERIPSLRAVPLAEFLHLVNEVPTMRSDDFVSQLRDQLAVVDQASAMQGALRLQQRRNIARYLCYMYLFSAGMILIGLSLVLIEGLSSEELDYQGFDRIALLSFVVGLISLISTVAISSRQSESDEDDRVWRMNDLQRDPQNTHNDHLTHASVSLFNTLRNVISDPINSELVKARIKVTIGHLCRVDHQFKAEMIAMSTRDTDRNRFIEVKQKIYSAVDYMLSEDQADQIPFDYPAMIKVGEVLTYVWTCIEKLSLDGHEDKARLLAENLMKSLYASAGLCNTGYVMRVLQGFDQSIRFSLNMSEFGQIGLALTPQDFYTVHQNDLYQLVDETIGTPVIRQRLLVLEQSHGAGTQDYKAAATQLIKDKFSSRLNAYLRVSHPQLLTSNAAFATELMDCLAENFAFFIDNARAHNENDTSSVASFAWGV